MEISFSIVDIKCHGDFTGSIEGKYHKELEIHHIIIIGQVQIISTLTLEDIYNLESGYYILTVTDNNNCNQRLQFFCRSARYS